MLIAMSFGFVALLIILGTYQGVRKYRTAVNPLTFIMLSDSLVALLFSGIVATYFVRPLWPKFKYSEDWIVYTALLSALSLIGLMCAFVVPVNGLTKLYGSLVSALGLSSARTATVYQPWRYWALVITTFAMFACVVVFGGGGMLWLTDPRWAYASKREGVLSYFMMAQWCLMSALVYYLWAKKPKTAGLIGISVALAALCIFTGSKASIFLNVLVAVIYYNYYIKRVPNWLFITAFPLMTVVIVVTIFIQQKDADMASAAVYFQDYFDSTAWYLSVFKDKFRYGGCELSNLWYFVPRPIFPMKPFDWGDRVVDTTLYPGAAEIGYTPGCLGWTTYYIDFGIIGVFVGSFITGLIRRVSYEYFLKYPDRFFAFLLCIQLALVRVYVESQILPVTIMIILVLAIFLRLRFKGRTMMPIPRANAPHPPLILR